MKKNSTPTTANLKGTGKPLQVGKTYRATDTNTVFVASESDVKGAALAGCNYLYEEVEAGEGQAAQERDKELFTQGEWEENPVQTAYTEIGIIEEKGRGFDFHPICTIEWNNPQAKANAELIASAPRLLRENKELARQLNDENTLKISAEVALDMVCKQRDELRNNLSKAGEVAYQENLKVKELKEALKNLRDASFKYIDTKKNWDFTLIHNEATKVLDKYK